MKKAFIILFIIWEFGFCFGQKKQCFCDKNLSTKKAPMSCKTTFLKNKSKLYWQFNCDRIWLTLQNVKRKKIIINEVKIDFYSYANRVGYQLIKA